MGDRVLEVVVYLMDHMRENDGRLPAVDVLSPDLRKKGYSEAEIRTAYSWLLDRYDTSHDTYYACFPNRHYSTRVLTEGERHLFSPEGYGFLVRLVNHGVIDDEQLESILERGGMFGPQAMTIDQVKMVASAVVFHEFEQYHLYPAQDSVDPSLYIN